MRIKTWKTGIRRRLDRLAQRPYLGVLYRAIEKSIRDRARDMAAAIAFYALFSLFPLLVGVVAIAGFLLDDLQAQARIYRWVSESFPGSAGLVRANVEAAVERRGAMGALGALGLLWSATSGFGAISRSLNRIWDVKRNYPIYLSKPRSFLLALAMTLLLLVSVMATAMAEVVPQLDFALLERLSGLDLSSFSLGQARLAGVAVTFLIFMLLYMGVPYRRPGWRQVLPGALVATGLFELGKIAFLLYLELAADFEAIYGSLSSFIVLLVWLYFSALVLVFGAELIVVRLSGPGESTGGPSPLRSHSLEQHPN